MIELIRNCAHGGTIATCRIMEDGQPIAITKASTSPAGLKALQQEVNGWRWYEARRYGGRQAKICRLEDVNGGHYRRLTIDYISGTRADYNAGLLVNAGLLEQAIEHYCLIWPAAAGPGPMHGDLSLDNIIDNQDGLHFIDWEHFHEQAAPWGFDALYLIYESLWFSTLGRRLPKKDEIEVVAALLRKIGAEASSLRAVREFILANRQLWGEQLQLFPEKLPILGFSESQVTRIDNLIKGKMRQ